MRARWPRHGRLVPWSPPNVEQRPPEWEGVADEGFRIG
jgi:hypothetical protein